MNKQIQRCIYIYIYVYVYIYIYIYIYRERDNEREGERKRERTRSGALASSAAVLGPGPRPAREFPTLPDPISDPTRDLQDPAIIPGAPPDLVLQELPDLFSELPGRVRTMPGRPGIRMCTFAGDHCCRENRRRLASCPCWCDACRRSCSRCSGGQRKQNEGEFLYLYINE